MAGIALDVSALEILILFVGMEHVVCGKKIMRIAQRIVLLIAFLELILVQENGLVMVNVKIYFLLKIQAVI